MRTPFPLQLRRSVVLASGSPRRRELLAMLGVAFTAQSPDVDETAQLGETPRDLVARLAAAKASAVSQQRGGAAVIGADTIVDVDGVAFGKPADADDARSMLRRLSGRSHVVHTGVAVAVDGVVRSSTVVSTDVEFAAVGDAVIDWYVGTDEPLDKAGAYAIQGTGAVLVTGIRGSVTNVVGLPLAELPALMDGAQ